MHYEFPAGLIKVPEEYRTVPLIPAPGLSILDISEVKKMKVSLAGALLSTTILQAVE